MLLTVIIIIFLPQRTLRLSTKLTTIVFLMKSLVLFVVKIQA